MRSIRQLWLTNANLSGSLPPVWATQMASMWEVDFVDCGLTGERWGRAAKVPGSITWTSSAHVTCSHAYECAG